MRRLLVCAWILCLAPLPARAEATHAEKIAALARLWATVKFAHPDLMTTAVDWDAPLLAALPTVDADLRGAAAGMLAALGDPATRVLPASVAPREAPMFSWPQPDLVVADLVALTQSSDYKAYREVIEGADKVRATIVDLRGSARVGDTSDNFRALLPLLPAAPPAVQRRVLHRGYRPQSGGDSGGYRSSMVEDASAEAPASTKPGPALAVFVCDAESVVPAGALSLVAGGQAWIVTTTSRLPPPGDLTRVALVDGIEAVVRTGEVVSPPVEAAARGTLVVTGDPMARALELARAGKAPPRATVTGVVSPPPVWRPDKTYPESKYPSRELRLLAVIRFWAVIDRFYAYPSLIPDWGAVLVEMIPRAEAAPDARAYAYLLAEMGTRIGDAHVWLDGSEDLFALLGRAGTPALVRLVEGQPTVVRLRGEEDARAAGIEIGDVIVDVDGQKVAARVAAVRPYLSASTPEAQEQWLAARILSGAAGTTAAVTVRGKNGKLRSLRLPRDPKYGAMPVPGPPWKKLPGDIGYVDLRLLRVPDVEPMLAELGGTRGIIFDMRGYPNATMWALAPRLNVKAAKVATQIHGNLVEAGEVLHYHFDQPVDATDKPIYRGKTVMLIDDRAISQSEHTGLYLEATAGVTFIGTRTAGTNGDVTRLTVPGGLTIAFTGHDIRHIDGRQLQRVGLVPHIEVKPTLAGVRAGRDEVLERAIRFIARGR